MHTSSNTTIIAVCVCACINVLNTGTYEAVKDWKWVHHAVYATGRDHLMHHHHSTLLLLLFLMLQHWAACSISLNIHLCSYALSLSFTSTSCVFVFQCVCVCISVPIQILVFFRHFEHKLALMLYSIAYIYTTHSCTYTTSHKRKKEEAMCVREWVWIGFFLSLMCIYIAI